MCFLCVISFTNQKPSIEIRKSCEQTLFKLDLGSSVAQQFLAQAREMYEKVELAVYMLVNRIGLITDDFRIKHIYRFVL